MSKNVTDRFWEKVDRCGEDECWEWRAGVDGKGYAAFSLTHENQIGGHVYSYLIHNGKIGDSWVCHKCDNPKCVNPRHLFLGNALDNNRDMVRKGRNRYLKGEEHPSSRLTENDVLNIRSEYAKGGVTMFVLADKYKISFQHVSDIVNKRKWAWL
jgi:hypothetical protein